MVFKIVILLSGILYFNIGLLFFIFPPEKIRNRISRMSNIQLQTLGLFCLFCGILVIYLLSKYETLFVTKEVLKDNLDTLLKLNQSLK